MSGTISATPPPPSPSTSEAPPSYNSLNPRPPVNPCPPPHSHFPIISVHHQSLASASASLRGAEEIQTITPPPPYYPRRTSFGFFRARHSLQQQDGESVPTSLSLIGKMKEAHQHSTNSLAFLRELGNIVLSTFGCMILIVFFMFVPLTLLVFGVKLVNDCPLQRHIPIFLIVGGLFMLVKTIFLIGHSIVLRNYTPRSTSFSRSGQKINISAWSVFNTLFNFLLLVWVFAGSYWVYSNYREVIKTGYLTCDAFLYKFTFTVITSTYVLLMSLCCTCIFVGTCFRINKKSAHSDDEGTIASDWIIARSDVIGACRSLEDERQRTDEEEGVEREAQYGDDGGVGDSVMHMNQQGGSIGEVPISLPPVGLASNREFTSSTGRVDVFFNMQAYSPTLPMDSEAAATLTVETTHTTSNTTRCTRRLATLTRLQQAYSNSSNLNLVPFRGVWNLGGSNNDVFQNTTASYVNLMPASAHHARSNPILNNPIQQTSQRSNANKRWNMTSGDHHSADSSLDSNHLHHCGSRTNMRGAKSNSSLLYATVLLDGYSTTHV